MSQKLKTTKKYEHLYLKRKQRSIFEYFFYCVNFFLVPNFVHAKSFPKTQMHVFFGSMILFNYYKIFANIFLKFM